jgi:NAD/NADP transhydrogenase alpha subunit
MSTTITSPAKLSTALSTVACLVATAALVRAADAVGIAEVRVVVADGQVSLQVPLRAGDQAGRIQAVAVYAHVLGSQVTDRDSRTGTCGEIWVETTGRIDGIEVHVWTITDPDTTGAGKER